MNIDRYIRPSNLAAIALCPARPTMESAVVEAEGEPASSEVADLGTDLHARSQRAIDSWKLCQETGERGALWGDAISLECSEATEAGIDSWSVFCLQKALEFVRDLIEKHDIHPDNVLTEHRLDMASLGFTQGGTADVVLVVPGKLVIVADFKYGFIDQGDADENDQTQAYAAAAAEMFQCDRVEVYLVQPRAEKPYRFTGATYDADTLRANRAWTAAVIRRARDPNPELEPGYSQCLYCKALLRCPSSKEFVMRAQEALELIGPPSDADAWGDLAGAAKLALKWGDDAKDRVKAHVVAGGSATGWKLGNPRAIRTITQVPAALQRLEQAGMGQAGAEALSMSLSKLPDEAADVIRDHITEKLSEPPLVADKRSKAQA